jgi:uncharacterized protein YbgA (DUF1722 family)/uncharacterized protein YbbK (DUF523 family)
MSRAPLIRIGISQCLLGEQVRYDGGHKRDAYVMEVLGKFFQWVPVCPEMEIGLGVPRESIHLVETDHGIRLRGVRSKNDITEKMTRYAQEKAKELSEVNLHGFIFKKDSPSCGLERVKIHKEQGPGQKKGRGLFADAIVRAMPLLPVEEEGRLNDLGLRENFVERVFCYFRWMEFVKNNPTSRKLIEFHSNHKMTLLSHHPELYRELGKIVAQSRPLPLKEYGETFMQVLKHRATSRKHSNCLYHLMGFLKKNISAEDKQELVDCIEEYRNERLPLVVPITLLLHHFRRNPVSWVMNQTYLNPYPSELMLRNHV